MFTTDETDFPLESVSSTESAPGALGAVSRPLLVIVPPPVADQVYGATPLAAENWSVAPVTIEELGLSGEIDSGLAIVATALLVLCRLSWTVIVTCAGEDGAKSVPSEAIDPPPETDQVYGGAPPMPLNLNDVDLSSIGGEDGDTVKVVVAVIDTFVVTIVPFESFNVTTELPVELFAV
jgi:hypothetical protein